MATTTREAKLEEVVLKTILALDKLPAVSGYSDAVIYAVEGMIAALKAAVRKN